MSAKAIRVLAIYEIVCGAMGLFWFYMMVMGGWNPPFAMTAFLLSLCSLGIYAGLGLMKSTRRGLLLSRVFQGIQIVFVAGPAFSYKLCVGVALYIGWASGRVVEMPFTLDFFFSLNDPSVSFGLSVNLLALIAFWYLMKDSVGALCSSTAQGEDARSEDDSISM